jgi:transposase
MIKKEYSDEFKLEVVRAYLNGPHGVRVVASTYGLPSKNYIERWTAELRQKGLLNPGEVKKESKTGSTVRKEGYEGFSSGKKTEREKFLEKENLRLRAENAFLKKLKELEGGDARK